MATVVMPVAWESIDKLVMTFHVEDGPGRFIGWLILFLLQFPVPMLPMF